MNCKTCDALLADYEHSVSSFKEAVRNFTGAIGEDSRLGAKEVERLRAECHDADDALTEHWRQHHPELAKLRSRG